MEVVKRDFEEDKKRREDPEAVGDLRQLGRANVGKCGGSGGRCCGMGEFAHLAV